MNVVFSPILEEKEATVEPLPVLGGKLDKIPLKELAGVRFTKCFGKPKAVAEFWLPFFLQTRFPLTWIALGSQKAGVKILL